MLNGAMHAGFETAAVEARETAGDFVWKERIVARGDERVGNEPDVFLRSHPMQVVEACEVHRLRVGAQGTLAAQIVVVLEVTERQLAKRAIDGRAKAEAGEVGFGDSTPEAARAIESDNVVVVANGFEIHDEGRKAVGAQSGGSDKRTFHAMAFAFAQNTLRRPSCVGVLVSEGIDERLNARRVFEGAESAEILRRKTEGFAAVAA